MNRYFIYLGYNGKNFSGWQIQPNGLTVQQCLEEALATLLRRPVPVVGAGRTDAGVHARLMVAHFDWDEPLADPAFLAEKLNRLLPKDIAVYRRIYQAGWKQEGDVWVFTVQADRFLRNMVRAIVGTLLEVGRGKLTIDGFRKVIEAKDRCKAGGSVPGHALFLVNVTYPESLFEV